MGVLKEDMMPVVFINKDKTLYRVIGTLLFWTMRRKPFDKTRTVLACRTFNLVVLIFFAIAKASLHRP